jgi:hypothetical protein
VQHEKFVPVKRNATRDGKLRSFYTPVKCAAVALKDPLLPPVFLNFNPSSLNNEVVEVAESYKPKLNLFGLKNSFQELS